MKTTIMPTERIARAVNPTEPQRDALNALNEAANKAAEFLKANCSTAEPLTPTSRVVAMEQRLQTMSKAISIVEPALQNFYGLLTDEQKARFNELGLSQGSLMLSGSIRDAGPSAVARSRSDYPHPPVLHIDIGR